MACLPRFVIPDQPQHLIVRGNNRSDIFCAGADYNLVSQGGIFYNDLLTIAASWRRWRVPSSYRSRSMKR